MHDEEDDVKPQKGTEVLPSIPLHSINLRPRKLRKPASQQFAPLETQLEDSEMLGLSSRLRIVSLNDERDSGAGGQVPSKPVSQPPSHPSQSDVEEEATTPKSQPDKAARFSQSQPLEAQECPVPSPATPPPIRRAKVAIEAMEKMDELVKSVRKNPSSPTKSCSPAKPPFLTKDSNLTNFVGWDVDGRLNEFESQFKVMKEAFDVSIADKRTLEEVIELAKNRGWLP